jgi:AGCS family alanine or glycine:cation symporter
MAAIAPLGMATKYAETYFGIRHRRKMPDGSMLGGPMVYLADGANLKGLGFAFALCMALGAIGAGNLAQANSVTLVMYTQFAVPKWLSGLLLAGVLASVIIGGIKRIGQVAERLVPAMVMLYVAGVGVILILNAGKVPGALLLIVESAFSPVAATGGFAGSTVARTIEYGIRRGVISSEAGLGSAGVAHSAAITSDPDRQGVIAMMGVFIDTVIVCMATALTVGSHRHSTRAFRSAARSSRSVRCFSVLPRWSPGRTTANRGCATSSVDASRASPTAQSGACLRLSVRSMA